MKLVHEAVFAAGDLNHASPLVLEIGGNHVDDEVVGIGANPVKLDQELCCIQGSVVLFALTAWGAGQVVCVGASQQAVEVREHTGSGW